jgi:hypothetical protein
MGRRKPTSNSNKEHDDMIETSIQSTADRTNRVSSDTAGTGGDGGSGIGTFLKSCLNLSTISTLLVCFYLYTSITSMRSLIYPLEGIEVINQFIVANGKRAAIQY